VLIGLIRRLNAKKLKGGAEWACASKGNFREWKEGKDSETILWETSITYWENEHVACLQSK
jgi:hypothetical protein